MQLVDYYSSSINKYCIRLEPYCIDNIHLLKASVTLVWFSDSVWLQKKADTLKRSYLSQQKHCVDTLEEWWNKATSHLVRS